MTPPVRGRTEILEFLRTAVADELHLASGAIDPVRPLTFYGLDSLTAAVIGGELADWLGRPLPEDLLLSRATLSSLADRLAAPVPSEEQTPVVAARASDRTDYAALDYSRTPPLERFLKAAIKTLVGMTSRMSVEGQEWVPAAGPVLCATNHLHILDALWLVSALPRRTILLVAEEFERKPIVGWLLNAGRAIYIGRGKSDREALDRALSVLEAGGVLGVAPEGKLSRTGGLIKGQVGVAYLASRAGVPVVPVVAWGQDRAGRYWKRLQRVPVRIRFGPPIEISSLDLESGTEQVMRSLARLLPPGYRGIYGDAAGGKS
jgi:1-acyl-sn-glycerol-3-phosphate acyltransferase